MQQSSSLHQPDKTPITPVNTVDVSHMPHICRIEDPPCSYVIRQEPAGCCRLKGKFRDGALYMPVSAAYISFAALNAIKIYIRSE